ncbi:MAG: HD domain-containing protein [Oscillospiraceae bacterium]|nr:HD domain-containing protein [Oscillospiraceae bacterium]
MNFVQIGTGAYEGFAILKRVAVKTGKNGMDYLDMLFADMDGELPAKLWSYNPQVHGTYNQNQIVKVRGTHETFRDMPQFRVERIRPITDEDNVDMSAFVPEAPHQPQEMYDALIAVAAGFEDETLKALVTTLYEERKSLLMSYPAAFRLHHAVRSGLLWHTLSVVRLCESVAAIYPFLRRDLLLAGAMLHDICKLDEYTIEETGLSSGYTAYGTLVGHLVQGAMLVEREGKRLGVPEDTRMLLAHMLISHHGEPEYGAASRPLFLEAEVLSQCDLLDATIYEFHEAQRNVAVGDFSPRQWALKDRKIYNHGASGNLITNIL